MQMYLFEAHQLGIVEDEEDAADYGPAQEVYDEAEEREPDIPGCTAHGPQTGGAGDRLPALHQQLHTPQHHYYTHYTGIQYKDDSDITGLVCLNKNKIIILNQQTQLY